MTKTTEQDEAAGRAADDAQGGFVREAELRDAALADALGGADLEHCGRMRD